MYLVFTKKSKFSFYFITFRRFSVSVLPRPRSRENIAEIKKKLFVAFPWVETSTGPGGLE